MAGAGNALTRLPDNGKFAVGAGPFPRAPGVDGRALTFPLAAKMKQCVGNRPGRARSVDAF